MLSVILWIIGGIGILCIIVFPGKRKGALPVSDRETMISDAACNIAATSFILTQMLFPIYGYSFFRLSYSFNDPKLLENYVDELKRILPAFAINFHQYFDNKPETSVYAFVMLTALFFRRHEHI